MCWSGTNLAANSMQLSATPDEGRPAYIAVFACVTSLVGVSLGTMCGGALLEAWEDAGWFTGGGFLDRVKVLVILATTLRLLSVWLLVPPLENDREGTPRQLLSALLRFGSLRRLRLRR